MSTTPTPTLSRQGKGKKEKRPSQTQQNERLKIVVRRLPPNLPEDIFWQSVVSWVTEDTTTWKIFYPGKLRKKLNKENIPSRAYIAFKSEEQLALFGRQYDGHVFKDRSGVESQAVVEFAPHPKIPSDKKKADGRSGTIEKDEDYISFIESLKAAENVEPVSIEALIASTQPVPPPKTTPLLEALKAEKSAAKDKEAILRNHAHYKQGDARREDKKKATTAAPTQKVAADAQTSKQPLLASKKKKIHAQEQSQVSDVQVSGIAARNMGDVSASTVTNNPPLPTSQAKPARRPRPVIASRQFEAALNTAGLATSASERKKRENVKDAVSGATVDDRTATSSRLSKRELQVTTSSAQASNVSGSSGLDTEAQSPLPSPKRDRSKRGGRPGGPGHAGTQSSAIANPTTVKVPSILQRSDTVASSSTVPRQTSSNADLSLTKGDLNSLPIPDGSPPRGRGRRARGVGGRGVGRGGGRSGQAMTAPRESG